MVQSTTNMKKSKSIRVLVLLSQTLKAARDEISGVLRAASRRPDLDVRILNRNLPPRALREQIAAWTPHGIITDNRGAIPAILPESRPNCITFKDGGIHHIPIVYLDFVCPSASSVCVDNAAIGKCAADFFLRRKYEYFAFVGTNLSHTAGHSQSRFDSFRNAVKKKGFDCSQFVIDENNPNAYVKELERLRGWIADLPKPCGILAHADVYAQLVTDACHLAKVNMPEQAAIIGVDNETDITDNSQPTLSSILPDFEKAGEMSLETLARLIEARRTPRTPFRIFYGVKTLIERESTQDTHGANRLVDAARGIIRKRSHEGIRVADIARELHVSGRLLELHFKSVLGHSVRDELLSNRLDEVKHRLQATHDQIESIAAQCGWRSPIALKILFKKRFGMSMRDWRKRQISPKP